MTSRAFLAALQLADNALPIGRFVHSHGLEAWCAAHPEATPDKLAELVQAVVCEGVAPLDGSLVAHAHRVRSLEALRRLDSTLTARKLASSSRTASQTCGGQLAAIALHLAPCDSLVAELDADVRAGMTDGNLAIVAGTLARALSLDERSAVLIELRGAASSLLSAAVRLGVLGPTDAQSILARMAPALVQACDGARSLSIADLASSAPELELHALTHGRTDGRLFVT